MHVCVDVDPYDVLADLSDDELRKEIQRRKLEPLGDELEIKLQLENVWRDSIGKNIPESLRKFIWDFLGRIV